MVPAGGIVLAYARDCWRRIVTKVLTGLTPYRLQISRFAEETQVTAQLEHPNIAPVRDMGLTGWGGQPLYPMKWIRGDSAEGTMACRASGRVLGTKLYPLVRRPPVAL